MSQKKSKAVLLRKYLFENDYNVISKKNLIGLLNAAITPIFGIKNDINIIYRIFDETIKSDFSKYIKRTEFLNTKKFDLKDIDCDEIQFLIISTQEYNCCILFDFSLAENPLETVFASYFNSKQSTDILKILLPKEKLFVERRDNFGLNIALSNLIKLSENYLQELGYNEAEKNNLEDLTQSLKRDEYLAQKARYISHEIKNHLSIIDIYTKIIEKVCCNNEKAANAAGTIFNAISNITKLLGDLKGFTDAELNVYDLSSVINDSIKSTTEMALSEGVIINTFLEDGINVVIDKDKFQNVLLNLIKNAVEAFKNVDNKEKNIEISTQLKDEKISLKIKNNGEKIDKKNQQNIFEEGFTTKSTGTGLGLFICKQNLKEQFCDLTLLKSDNKETVFEISMNKV